jgi:hypothetical protein
MSLTDELFILFVFDAWEKVAVPVPIITTNKRVNRFFIKVDFSKSKIGKIQKGLKSKDWIGGVSFNTAPPFEHKKPEPSAAAETQVASGFFAIVLILFLKEKRLNFRARSSPS